MSQTTTPAVPATSSASAARLAEWAPFGTAIIAMGTFLGALVFAYIRQDATSINLLVGAVITNASTAVNYYLGSSRSSAAKDATIAQIALAPTPTTTTAP